MNKCLFFSLVLTFSCTINSEMNQEDGFGSVPFIVDSFSYNGAFDEVMTKDFGVYSDFLVNTDFSLGLSSAKDDPRDREYIIAFTDESNPALTRSSEGVSLSFTVDEIDLFSPEVRSSQGPDINQFFGKDVLFKIKSSVKTRSSESETSVIDQVSLYVPQVLTITSPDYSAIEGLYPLCDYSSFVLNWDPDPNNQNGVLLILTWDGDMVFGDSYSNVLIRRIDRFPDTGSVNLCPELFDGIPDTALCSILLLRGNVENILIEDYSCKVSAESHVILPFVLLKHISHR